MNNMIDRHEASKKLRLEMLHDYTSIISTLESIKLHNAQMQLPVDEVNEEIRKKIQAEFVAML